MESLKYKIKAFITVESSFIFPMILLLYVLLIQTSVFLFTRCLTEQNSYIKKLRESRYSYYSVDYAEAIYVETEAMRWL